MILQKIRSQKDGVQADRSSTRRDRIQAWLKPETGALRSIPALDGLRGVAVLLVIVYHAWLFSPVKDVPASTSRFFPIFYGRTGVQLFFVLSGFLLFLPYAQWMFGLRDQPSARLFYRRRILRVGPAYWASLLILFLTGPITAGILANVLAHVVFLANIRPDWVYSIDVVYWTMAVEVQFYVTLPFIAVGAYALSRKVHPLLAGLLAFAGLFAISLGVRALDGNPALRQQPVLAALVLGGTHMPEWLAVFGIGIGSAVAYTYLTRVAHMTRRKQNLLAVAGGALFVAGSVFALAIAFVPALQTLDGYSYYFGLAYGAMVLGILHGPDTLRRWFGWGPLRFLGLISYSMYLWHNVLLMHIQPYFAAMDNPSLAVALAFVLDFALSLPVAYLSYQLMERPFIHARKRAHKSTRSMPRIEAAAQTGY